MNTGSSQIVQKLWHYCNLLRDDGLSYPDYVEQLTYLIFLKMADEQDVSSSANQQIPRRYSWTRLMREDDIALHRLYSKTLEVLGRRSGMIGMIFHGAKNRIRDPNKLRRLMVELIGRETWTGFDADVKGDAYEGLLEKTARDTKSGAGQYFTPRPLIRAIVEVVDPGVEETVCDPACGTCGFLLATREHVLSKRRRMSGAERRFQQLEAYRGMELVESVARLGAMNLLLHGIGPVADECEPPITVQDSLEAIPSRKFDVVLTNPPFGNKSSVRISAEGTEKKGPLVATRSDFFASTANKQLNFLQHVANLLGTKGRAAVVIPDNVLFELGAGEKIRRALLKHYDVHTLLRLPTGLFYAQGIKANVLFFDARTKTGRKFKEALWIYDFRTDKHFTLQTKPLTRGDLREFVELYRADDRTRRKATWSASNRGGRWRSYGYDELQQRGGCNLDLMWLKGEKQLLRERRVSPDLLANQIADDLRSALVEIEAVVNALK
jgi:type I restriction enzyme M protein